MPTAFASPIRDEYIQPLDDAIAEGLELLGLEADATPPQVIEKMQAYVDDLLTQPDPPTDDMASLRLGALWGHTVVRQYDWKWVGITWAGGKTAEEPAICVVSPGDWYCVPPLMFIDRIISRHNMNHVSGENENTIKQTFDMLEGVEDNPPTEKYQILA